MFNILFWILFWLFFKLCGVQNFTHVLSNKCTTEKKIIMQLFELNNYIFSYYIKKVGFYLQKKHLPWYLLCGSKTNTLIGSFEHFCRSIFYILKSFVATQFSQRTIFATFHFKVTIEATILTSLVFCFCIFNRNCTFAFKINLSSFDNFSEIKILISILSALFWREKLIFNFSSQVNANQLV